jgi:hypothetical protein
VSSVNQKSNNFPGCRVEFIVDRFLSLTYAMERRPWEADSSSASQEITCLFWIDKVITIFFNLPCMLYYGLTISNVHTCRLVDGHNKSNRQSHQVICACLKHKLQINCKGLFSFFFFSSSSPSTSSTSVFYSPMWTFASLMDFSQWVLFFDLSFQFVILHLLISVSTEFCHLYLVVLLLDFPEDYCQILDLLFLYYPFY